MNSIIAVAFFHLILIFVGEVEMASQNPATGEEFQVALDQATAGDVITLLPQEYVGNFIIKNSGTEGNPIVVTGSNFKENHTIINSGGAAKSFDIKANYVRVEAMAVKNSELAIEVFGDGIELKSLAITGIRKGIIITGDKNSLADAQIESSDVAVLITKGVGNSVASGNINSLIISAPACCGSVVGTKINGLFDVNGSKYNIQSVLVQGISEIKGCENVLTTYLFQGMSNIAECNTYYSVQNFLRSFGLFGK